MKRVLFAVLPFVFALFVSSVVAGEAGEWTLKVEKKEDGTYVAKTSDGKELALTGDAVKAVTASGEYVVKGELADDKKTIAVKEIAAKK